MKGVHHHGNCLKTKDSGQFFSVCLLKNNFNSILIKGNSISQNCVLLIIYKSISLSLLSQKLIQPGALTFGQHIAKRKIAVAVLLVVLLVAIALAAYFICEQIFAI